MTEQKMPDKLKELKDAVQAFEQDYQALGQNRIWIALMNYLTSEMNNDCWFLINTTISTTEKANNIATIEQHRGIVRFLQLLRPILARQDWEDEDVNDEDLYPKEDEQ